MHDVCDQGDSGGYIQSVLQCNCLLGKNHHKCTTGNPGLFQTPKEIWLVPKATFKVPTLILYSNKYYILRSCKTSGLLMNIITGLLIQYTSKYKNIYKNDVRSRNGSVH